MRLRGPFARWLEATGAREKRRAFERSAGVARVAAHRAFLGGVIDAAMAECPGLTREVLCLATFTPPEAFDARPMADYLEAVLEMYECPAIRDFFTLWPSPKPGTSSGV